MAEPRRWRFIKADRRAKVRRMKNQLRDWWLAKLDEVESARLAKRRVYRSARQVLLDYHPDMLKQCWAPGLFEDG
jgi:hypothetical protein